MYPPPAVIYNDIIIILISYLLKYYNIILVSIFKSSFNYLMLNRQDHKCLNYLIYT